MIKFMIQSDERVALRHPLIWYMSCFCLLLTCACTQMGQKNTYINLQGKAQGTTFTISYDDSQSRDFSHAVDSLFRLMDKSMSLWDTASIITAVNSNRDVPLDEHFTRVFNKSKEVFRQTEGAFDMTVGPLVRRWGFSYKKNQAPPDSLEVQALLSTIGMETTTIEGNRLVKKNPAIEIDFNAIAQGYTVDLLADYLEGKGVQNYMVEVGGEVKAKGVSERNVAWNIAIDKPLSGAVSTNHRPIQCIVPLQNKSLVTSGSYRKFIEHNGRKYSHAINPKTGFPVEHNLLSVTVLANGCMEADAYATAFLVMGLEETKRISKDLGLAVYCIFEKEDGTFGTFASVDFEYQEINQ